MQRLRDLKAGPCPPMCLDTCFQLIKCCAGTQSTWDTCRRLRWAPSFPAAWRCLLGIFFLQVTHCWWECETVQILWKSVWQFLERLDIKLPGDLTILRLGISPRELKTCLHKNLSVYVHGSLFINSQSGNNPNTCKLMKG